MDFKKMAIILNFTFECKFIIKDMSQKHKDPLTQCSDLMYVTNKSIKSGWPHHLISLMDLFYSK